MKKYLIILTLLTFKLSFSQAELETRLVLNKWENGNTMREHIQYENSDTLIENVYYETGELNIASQIANDQRNGWSKTYNEQGNIIFLENYRNSNLSGEFLCYYTSGKVQRIEFYENGNNINSSYYFSKSGDTSLVKQFKYPCKRGTNICYYKAVVYSENQKVYSYQVIHGKKSEEHEIIDLDNYKELMVEKNQIPLYDQGETLFKQNCAMCHKLETKLVGPPLKCHSKTMSKESLKMIIESGTSHPTSNLNDAEMKAILEYFRKNCPQQ